MKSLKPVPLFAEIYTETYKKWHRNFNNLQSKKQMLNLNI